MAWTWTGAGGDSNWENPANWNVSGTTPVNSYPTSAGDGTVYIGAGAVIAIPGAELINALYITGSGTASISGAYALSANGAVSIAAGATLSLSATTTLLSYGITVTGTGTAILFGGTFNARNNLISVPSGDTLILAGAQVMGSGTSGTGTITLNGSTVTFESNAPTTTINFASVSSGGAQNVLNMPNWSTGVNITGFGYGDVINEGNNPMQLVANGVGNPYLLETTGGNVVGTATLAPGTPGAGGAAVGSPPITLDNASGNNTYPCFYPGTMLATSDGEIAVEDVTIGMMLKTVSGKLLPVRWIGWSQVSTIFADPLRALPIRIKAGALADGVPVRDLLVSPDHAIFIDDVLVQAAALVNGTSIFREENVPESFRYYHVELATHELLLADGCPAESFVDNIDRMNFHNWDVRTAPDAAVEEMDLPRAKSVRQVPASILAAIAGRAARFVNTCAA